MTATANEPEPMTAERAQDILRTALAQARLAVIDLVGHQPTIEAITGVLDQTPAPDVVRLRAELREVSTFLFVEASGPAKRAAMQAIDEALKSARMPLRCPDCGETLSVAMGRDRWGYDEVEAIECDNARCNATWNHRTGQPKD